jgi:hypothetical protein
MATTTTKVFVPSDTTARSLGADAVAKAIAAEAARRGAKVEIVRNGSHGLYWLEPLVEVAVDGVRHAYGPVTAADVPKQPTPVSRQAASTPMQARPRRSATSRTRPASRRPRHHRGPAVD